MEGRQKVGFWHQCFSRTQRWAGLVLLFVALLAACGAPQPSPVALPQLAGRLIFLTENTYDSRDHRLWQAVPRAGEIIPRETAGEPLTLPATPDPFECLDQAEGVFCTYSPAGPYSLVAAGKWRLTDWSDHSQGFLVNVDSLAELQAEGTTCKAVWRPDGQKVAVNSHFGLFVAGTDRLAEQVLAPRREFYTEEGAAAPGELVSHYILYSTLSCPVWLTPDDLLVSHFSGDFPERIDMSKPMFGIMGEAGHNALDTTSVLHLSASGVERRDLSTLWQVEAIDPAGLYAVLSRMTGAGTQTGDLYLTEPATLATGQDQGLIPLVSCGGQSSCALFRFGRDGQRIAYSVSEFGGSYAFEIWERGSGSVSRFSIRPDAPPGGLFWSPRGDALAIEYGANELYLYLLDEGRVAPLAVIFPRQEGLYFELVGWVEP